MIGTFGKLLITAIFVGIWLIIPVFSRRFIQLKALFYGLV